MMEMFYLTTHSTNFIYGYGVSHMVKDHSDSERGNLRYSVCGMMHIKRTFAANQKE